jgi:hypothetical protein
MPVPRLVRSLTGLLSAACALPCALAAQVDPPFGGTKQLRVKGAPTNFVIRLGQLSSQAQFLGSLSQ